jgi:23S rRNA (cytidine2498-2'-O)-methyltransferase
VSGGATFVFAACNPGSEAALKREVARAHPALRPSYGRPGFVTFKATAPQGATAGLPGVALARVAGASLGPADGEGAIAAAAAAFGGAPLHLHVWERDAVPPEDAPPDRPPGHRAAALAAAVRAAAPAAWHPPRPPADGEHVLDVVCAADPAEPPWLGHHIHSAAHLPWPGGIPPVSVPPDAPSRALRKLEEMVAAIGLPVAAGQVALELGAAPGGAALALLRRGLTVVGVDPGAIDPIVLAHPGFTHLATKMGGVDRAALPPRVDWLLCDVHLAPQVALHQLRRFLPPLRDGLRGLIWTLKLNRWEVIDEVPALLASLGELGFADVRARQLPGHRQELGVVARR